MRLLLFFAALAFAGCNCQPTLDPCEEGVCVPDAVDSGSTTATATDSGTTIDAGAPPDSGAADSGVVLDSGTPDAGVPDAGPIDSGIPDAGAPLGPSDGGLWCIEPSSVDVSGDIRTAQQTITLTLNGVQFPNNGTSPRGLLQFIDREWDEPLTVNLGATGPATATATLLHGTYDVVFFSGGVPGVPNGSITVARGLVVSAAGAHTFDLKTVAISGSVTVNGQPFPASSSDRGSVAFKEAAGRGSVAFPMGKTGAVAYSGLAFAGTFDVVLDSSVPLPINRKLATGVTLTTPASRIDNLVLAPVTGTVTLDGQSFPNGSFIRASVEFFEPNTTESYFFGAGITGPGAYSAQVPPSTYDVYLNTTDTAPAPLPVSARTKLASGLVVSGATTVNWNAETLDFTGTLTLNGQPFPLPPVSGRGAIWFRDRIANEERTFPLPDSGPATITARLFKGTYDIGYLAPNFPIAGVPLVHRTSISQALALNASITLPMALETVTLDTSLSVDGQPRATTEWTASIAFHNRWGGGSARAMSATGPAQLQVLVYKNLPYDVSVAVDTMEPGSNGSVPTKLLRDVSFQSSGPLALNARTIPATGSITHNGLPFPAATKSRGNLYLTNDGSGWYDKLALPAAGPITISKKVFAAPHDVTFQVSDGVGLTGTPTKRLARACLASACRATSNDVTGTWQLTVLGFFYNTVRVELVEQAGAITGQLSYNPAYEIINRGSRVGDTVRFTTNGYLNAAIYDAKLESPCRMSGTMDVPGYHRAKFFAIR